MRGLLLLPCLLLVACADTRLPIPTQDLLMNPMTELKAKLAFTCTHEKIPAASEESDVLFQYARWLQKNNQLKRGKTINLEIERLYRIAAENGHFKANINLQNGGMRGQFEVYGHEYLRFSQELIDAKVATGYYLISLLLEKGAAGLQQDSDMALRYLSKAANSGNARAQFVIAEKLEPSNVAPDIAFQMFRCSAEQGHGEAAIALGINLKNQKQYSEAVKVFQMGVAAGDENAAGRLDDAFRSPKPENKIDYLAQEKDLERADRYEKIWRILANYSYANPKVPEINDIVPLPPAKLPPWDGKLKWLEEREANIPPEKPSQELIQRLAGEKKLDPATGRPLPGSPVFSQAHLSAPDCGSGKTCPVSGYWQVRRGWNIGSPDGEPIVRHFKEGDRFPTEPMLHYKFRDWPFTTKVTRKETHVFWTLA